MTPVQEKGVPHPLWRCLSAVCALLLLASPSPASVVAPQWVGVYDLQGKAGLLWIKAPGVASYHVYRRRDDEPSFTLMAKTEANRWTDDAIQPRIAYRYRLVAVDAAGVESPPSGEVSFTLLPKVREALGSPRLEGHILTERGIGLKWSHPDPQGVVAYNIYRSLLPDGREELLVSTRDNQYTDSRVESGRRYRYRVSALDDTFKESPLSVPLDVEFVRKVVEEVAKAPVYRWVPRKTYLVRTVTGGKAFPFRNPTDVAVSPQGLLFVADSGNGLIQVFTRNGDYRYEFPVPPALQGGRSNPLGVTVDRDGLLLVSDASSSQVSVFQARGSLVRVLPLPLKPGEEAGILDVGASPDGKVWVVDNLNHRLARFNEAGKFSAYVGEPGPAPGQLSAPGFCLVDPKGRLFLTDALGARVQIFDADGRFERAFGRYGKNVGGFGRPKGVALDSRGRVYVADSWLSQIQVFDQGGKYLFGLADEKGRPLDLGSPNGIFVDGEDNIYIAERLAGRVQIRHIQND